MAPNQKLPELLARLGRGDVPPSSVAEVEQLLACLWDELDVQTSGMEAYKLHRRTEKLKWQPPVLTFDLERHGAVVVGNSSRAELQTWSVNLDANTAVVVSNRKRQIRPADRRLDVDGLACEIGELIATFAEDHRLKWKEDKKLVTPLIAKIIPTTNRMTTQDRRKRFTSRLIEHLDGLGWQRKAGSRPLIFIAPERSTRVGEVR